MTLSFGAGDQKEV